MKNLKGKVSGLIKVSLTLVFAGLLFLCVNNIVEAAMLMHLYTEEYVDPDKHENYYSVDDLYNNENTELLNKINSHTWTGRDYEFLGWTYVEDDKTTLVDKAYGTQNLTEEKSKSPADKYDYWDFWYYRQNESRCDFYPLWKDNASGKIVTTNVVTLGKDSFDYLDDRGYKWDVATKTLTLDGAIFDFGVDSRWNKAFYVDGEELGNFDMTIVVADGSTNRFGIALSDDELEDPSKYSINGIISFYCGDLKIQGSGDLIVYDANEGILNETDPDYCDGKEGNIDLTAFTGTMTIYDYGCAPKCCLNSENGSIKISGGTYNFVSQEGNAIYAGKDVIIEGGNLNLTTYEKGTLYANGNIEISNATVKAESKSADESSPAIESKKGSITIKSGNVTATGNKGAGICAEVGIISILGGTVNVSSELSNGIFTKASEENEIGDISISGGIVNVKIGDVSQGENAGISTQGTSIITISGGTVNVDGGKGFAAISSNNVLKISGGDITASNGQLATVAAKTLDFSGGKLDVSYKGYCCAVQAFSGEGSINFSGNAVVSVKCESDEYAMMSGGGGSDYGNISFAEGSTAKVTVENTGSGAVCASNLNMLGGEFIIDGKTTGLKLSKECKVNGGTLKLKGETAAIDIDAGGDIYIPGLSVIGAAEETLVTDGYVCDLNSAKVVKLTNKADVKYVTLKKASLVTFAQSAESLEFKAGNSLEAGSISYENFLTDANLETEVIFYKDASKSETVAKPEGIEVLVDSDNKVKISSTRKATPGTYYFTVKATNQNDTSDTAELSETVSFKVLEREAAKVSFTSSLNPLSLVQNSSDEIGSLTTANFTEGASITYSYKWYDALSGGNTITPTEMVVSITGNKINLTTGKKTPVGTYYLEIKATDESYTDDSAVISSRIKFTVVKKDDPVLTFTASVTDPTYKQGENSEEIGSLTATNFAGSARILYETAWYTKESGGEKISPEGLKVSFSSSKVILSTTSDVPVGVYYLEIKATDADLNTDTAGLSARIKVTIKSAKSDYKYEEVETKAGTVRDITQDEKVTVDKTGYGASVNLTGAGSSVEDLFTQEEINEGVNVWLKMEDKNTNVSSEEKNLVEEALNQINKNLPEGTKAEASMYLDISMFKQVGNADPAQVSELNGKITFSFYLPDSFYEANEEIGNIVLMHLTHDGGWETLPTSYSVEGNKVKYSATTASFSTFVIIREKKVETPTPTPTEDPTPAADPTPIAETPKSPKTGVNTSADFMYLLLMVTGIIGIYSVTVKKENKR